MTKWLKGFEGLELLEGFEGLEMVEIGAFPFSPSFRTQ
jgi:hypothetical protein